MKSAIKIVPIWHAWQPWFAWRPVRVHVSSRMYVWVWGEWIERKFSISGYDYVAEYRLKP